MYSPTTRLLVVLSLLQTQRQMSGAEIARRLEVDVRTIRRYITSLQDMGVPVEGERGPHGAYYLGRGSKMPPLMFTNEEAVALVLGLRVIREFQFPVDGAAIEGAIAKTERVLPEPLLQQVRAIQSAVAFNVIKYGGSPSSLHDNTTLIALSTAAQERYSVELVYHSRQEELTERRFDPYGVVYTEGYWYTAGYCHLRQDLRTFRLDRIESITQCDEAFDDPGQFDVLDYVLSGLANVPGPYQVAILLKTTMDTALAHIPSYLATLEPCTEGIMMRRSANDLEWVAMLLLSLDFPVEIKGPDALRSTLRRVADRANRIAGFQSG
ncbi:MAG: YafY family protein [Aggregatilineales bacterium]